MLYFGAHICYNKQIITHLFTGDDMANQSDCIILGGGAGGLFACAYLASHGLNVTLVEKLDRVGKKLMAAGNGRCNISNTDMNPAYYGDAEAFVSGVYTAATPEDVLSFFAHLGLMTAVEDGRIYPRTMMASSVLDVLRAACDQPNVRLLTSCTAVSLVPSRRGGWSVELDNGEGLFAPYVLSALGGSAAPHLGTDGSGARLLGDLGHTVTPLYPALVQLRCDHGALRSLKGLRAQAELTLLIDGKSAAQETGELLFADYGVSGVCVFQLSGMAARALGEHKSVSLSVNLLPEIPQDQTADWLDSRIHCLSGASALQLLSGVFPRLLAMAVLKEAGVSPDAASVRLTAKERTALAMAICAFTFKVTGTQGFKQAQVTCGGVSLDDVEPRTMASRLYDGLYIAGETLDVNGPCGGYNLHFAFASALAASRAICTQLGIPT